MLPTDALIVASRHTGSRNHRVIERYSNAPWARQASSYLNRGADAETALISCTSKNGVEVTGYYDVLPIPTTRANGQSSPWVSGRLPRSSRDTFSRS
jgi:hypothetical protein